jgi:cytochrome oxidase Cu insertion factor (SCO1/SenC/PrrC family)
MFIGDREITKGGVPMKSLRIVMFLIVISLILDIPLIRAQSLEEGVEKFRVAVDAPDFTLTKLDGGKVSLKELRGKVIALIFFATW